MTRSTCEAPVRILVTDAQTRAVLAAIRGLHAAGFDVAAAADSGSRPASGHWSRAVDERLFVAHPIADEVGFVAAVERAVAGGTYAALIPGAEASLLAISRARHRLERHVRIGLPAHEVVLRSLDKRELSSAALRHGLTPPQTITCNSVEGTLRAAVALGFPVVLKPIRSVTRPVGWEGLFELELIERGDGGWAAIDLNPRPYGSLALAVAAGANLPAIWCEHLLGGEPESVSARPGVFYRWEDADLRNVLRQLLDGDTAGGLAALRPRRTTVHPYFELNDPGPFLARSLHIMGTAARGAIPVQRAAATRDVRDPMATRLASLRYPRSGSREPTVIIGAGPYGLSSAAYLRGAGIEARCFGEPLDFWRHHMPAGMILRSRKRSWPESTSW